VQVKISARHGHLNADTQAKISEKAEKLRRLFDRISAIEVTADLEHRETPEVEVRVSVEHTEDIVATAQSTTVMAALDEVIRKVEQQLRKHKERRRGHRASKPDRDATQASAETEDE
jgi:putative sigma-54 modulation protein